MSVNLKLAFTAGELTKSMREGLNRGLKKALINTQATIMEGFTKFPKPPIKTGQLRQSIRQELIDDGQGRVYAKKGYAQFVEYGTAKMAPRPFMRNGIAEAQDKNFQLIIDELGKL